MSFVLFLLGFTELQMLPWKYCILESLLRKPLCRWVF